MHSIKRISASSGVSTIGSPASLNEVFKISADTLQDYEIWIYDRWGELIFYSDNIEKGWDGSYKDRACQYGIYIWRLQYLCGEAIQTKIGTVTLIR